MSDNNGGFPDKDSSNGDEGGGAQVPSATRRAALLSAPTTALWAAAATAINSTVPGVAEAGILKGLGESAPPPIPVPSQCLSSGINAFRDPSVNRGLATPLDVRAELRMGGLLPPGTAELSVEVERALVAVRAARATSGLQAYQQLMTLRATNEDAFFALLSAYPEEMVPLVYTPTVGDACQQWGSLILRPQGLYISLNDAGKVAERVAEWPINDVMLAVVTDGERILGLGDLGAHGMGISVGKSMLYTVAAGVPPSQLLPIALDVGTANEALREDPFYVGLRTGRERGAAYDALVDELVGALRARYGASLLLHWEDFGSGNAFRLLQRYQAANSGPTFNDDIQSTAAAVLAALLGAVRVPGVPLLRDQRVLFYGAGQANLGAAKLFVTALKAEGLSEETARDAVWMMDSKGLITTSRTDLSPQKAEFARREGGDVGLNPKGYGNLTALIKAVRPTALLGAASVAGAFTEEALQALTLGLQEGRNPLARPVVMALSNPTSRAECSAEEALSWTGGVAVFASGTAFGPVTKKNGDVVVPSQANNSLIFPGIGMGCLAAGATRVTDEMFYAAAKAVAESTTDSELRSGSVLPSAKRIREVTTAVAATVAEEAVRSMVATSNRRTALPCLQDAAVARALAEGDDNDPLAAAGVCIKGLQYSPK